MRLHRLTTAFLNGDLEEVYMKPPEGYEQYSSDGCLLYCLTASDQAN